ncbi:hypothetical protein E3Q06_02863 [Wallemia mellicola]|nr:hypothetical protein E3Q24_02629 [Wallemia mellicola]TIB83417.1 hypothetical protein E3Q21_02930 [Wallemia mellicola]TIB86296.1 hypothetical protein E3Q20_02922 [Wallemia mellicola]TIC22160.1 hypothetical protein E3Q12_02856 [Wallemia mellicola]TIC39513.1 hypothetical protein E3Q07_02885 [Wallemia mellicola]
MSTGSSPLSEPPVRSSTPGQESEASSLLSASEDEMDVDTAKTTKKRPRVVGSSDNEEEEDERGTSKSTGNTNIPLQPKVRTTETSQAKNSKVKVSTSTKFASKEPQRVEEQPKKEVDQAKKLPDIVQERKERQAQVDRQQKEKERQQRKEKEKADSSARAKADRAERNEISKGSTGKTSQDTQEQSVSEAGTPTSKQKSDAPMMKTDSSNADGQQKSSPAVPPASLNTKKDMPSFKKMKPSPSTSGATTPRKPQPKGPMDIGALFNMTEKATDVKGTLAARKEKDEKAKAEEKEIRKKKEEYLKSLDITLEDSSIHSFMDDRDTMTDWEKSLNHKSIPYPFPNNLGMYSIDWIKHGPADFSVDAIKRFNKESPI